MAREQQAIGDQILETTQLPKVKRFSKCRPAI
jgi:hypothetical protein